MIRFNRAFQTPDWRQIKIEDPVSIPETLDLTAFARDGLAPGQVEMPEAADDSASSSSSGSGSGGGGGTFVIDEALVGTIMSMGFSENAAKRAAIMTDNAIADTAMEWVFAHMEDPDFHDDVSALLATKNSGGGAGGASEAADEGVTPAGMEALAVYGFSELQCRCALKATKGDLQRAVDWVFAHEGEDLEAAADAAVGGASAGAGAKDDVPEIGAAGEGKYQLMAQVSHLGPNMDHGHYVCR